MKGSSICGPLPLRTVTLCFTEKDLFECVFTYLQDSIRSPKLTFQYFKEITIFVQKFKTALPGSFFLINFILFIVLMDLM